MKEASYEDLVDEYKKCLEQISVVDYGNKNSVKKANRTVGRMIQISKDISAKWPERINDFADLMNSNKFRIDGWVAHHLLENMKYTPELEARAIEVITRYSEEDTVEGLGNRMWLSQWNEKKANRIN